MSVAAIPICLIGAVVAAHMAWRGEASQLGRGRTLAVSVALLLCAFAFVVAPIVAARIAENSTGWTDPDGDGMQGGMVNGGYDYLDVNGDVLFGVWSAAVTAIVIAFLVFLFFIRRGSSIASSPEQAGVNAGAGQDAGLSAP